jgi:hypothetical protein
MLAPTVNTLVSGNLPSLFFFTFFTTQDGGRCPPSSIPLSLPDPSTSFLSTWTRLLLLWTVTLGLFQMVCNIGEGLTAFPLYSPCSCTPCGFPVISQSGRCWRRSTSHATPASSQAACCFLPVDPLGFPFSHWFYLPSYNAIKTIRLSEE